ncbi:MAG: hypothetical protein M3R24_00170 [Chloroflexota bacterium]|nr:hypothetical protein [Chloroflexota bacterium]
MAEVGGGINRFEATHGPHATFQMLMVPFETIVEILRGAMLSGRHNT